MSQPLDSAAAGSLTVVGLGIQASSQITQGAIKAIEAADKVLFAVVDGSAASWLTRLNPTAESLEYDTTQSQRRIVYERIVERILAEVRKGLNVCVAVYGHPGVFAYAPHKAIRLARQEGFPAHMLPGVSAEDCLFADLGVDPGPLGCQSYEATDFLIRPRRFDPCTALILWQLALVGELGFIDETKPRSVGISILANVLESHYGATHHGYIYEAAVQPGEKPRIERVLLARLPEARITTRSTLFVPALRAASLDPAMMERLGLSFT